MAIVAFLVLLVLLAWFAVSIVRRRGLGVVAQRGAGIGADLGALRDAPRVHVSSVMNAGPDRVRLLLTPEPGPDDLQGAPAADDVDLTVSLDEDEFGFELLHQWKRAGTSLAIVMPPDTRIVRLRSIDDLQPLTLRRIDDE